MTEILSPTSKYSTYHGRFAPTPSGDLHFGSLLAAMASYLDARQQRGKWSVRIDDLDTPRIAKGSIHSILKTLENYGFQWDGNIDYQSSHHREYAQVLEKLEQTGKVYSCSCRRKQIQAQGQRNSHGEVIYPGICRQGHKRDNTQLSSRLRVENTTLYMPDLFQQANYCKLAEESGDFILKRSDGIFSWLLAAAVDDARAGITHIIRGQDLFLSSCRQVLLQQALQQPIPEYGHIPLACDASGAKLGKQTRAPSLPEKNKLPVLLKAWGFLRQKTPKNLELASTDEFWQYAIKHWSRVER